MSHIHEKIDFTAEVFIVYGNKVLLRKHDKYKMWLSVGGHIELDEDPNQAAVREVKEEVGLDISIAGQALEFRGQEGYRELIPPVFLNRHKISDSHEHISLVYFGIALDDKISQGQGEISDDVRWFTMEELASPDYDLGENIRHYARRALEELGNKA
jgi:8-oxo-dGTP pyrophosphatase MutT (NUDIX family)